MANRSLMGKRTYVDRRGRGIDRASERRGAVLVWVAILGVVLIGFVGLSLDAGVVLLAGTQLQIAADAGALAGARYVGPAPDVSRAREEAARIAHENKAAGDPVSLELNEGNALSGDIVIGRYHRFAETHCEREQCCTTPPCFFPQVNSPNAVRVNARRTRGSMDGQVAAVFGSAFNVLGIDVARTATAMTSGSTGGGVITLDPDSPCTLDLRGNVLLDVQSAPGWDGDTAIHVDSDDPCAVCGRGRSLELVAPETNIVGSEPGYCFDGDPALDTYLNPDSPYMPDPLADLDAPPRGTPANPGRISNDTIRRGRTVYDPGYYPDGLEINIGDIKLNPGIYVLGGDRGRGGLQVVGGAGLTALNVLLYVEGGPVDIGGAGSIIITPMTEAVNTNSDYIGISIFQARENTEVANITGNAQITLEGTYYFPTARVEIGGTGMALGNQLICWQLYLHGNGQFTIRYDGSFPSPGSKVFLVQ